MGYTWCPIKMCSLTSQCLSFWKCRPEKEIIQTWNFFTQYLILIQLEAFVLLLLNINTNSKLVFYEGREDITVLLPANTLAKALSVTTWITLGSPMSSTYLSSRHTYSHHLRVDWGIDGHKCCFSWTVCSEID